MTSETELKDFLKEWLGVKTLEQWTEDHVHAESDERILFSGDLKVFIKDFDATLQLITKGCYLRGENLHVWFNADNLTGNAGSVIAIPPRDFQNLLRFGGTRNVIKGDVLFQNGKGDDYTLGKCKWFRMSDGRYGLIFEFPVVKDGKLTGKAELMRARDVGEDYPFQFQYGVNIQAGITLI